MTRSGVTRTELQETLARVFEKKRERVADLPVLRSMLAELGPRAVSMMEQCAGMQVAVALGSISQARLVDLTTQSRAAVAICATVPEWREPAICQLDRRLLFCAFDAMYGGVPGARTEAPERPLTSLERSLAALIGGGLMRQLAQTLEQVCIYSIKSEHCVEEDDLAAIARGKGEYLVVRLRIDERDDGVMLAIPVSGLENARDRLTATEEAVSTNPDPAFSKSFRRMVASTPVEVVASAEGPTMLLSDVARLQPGTSLEFEGSRLRQVLVEGGAQPIFTGRLGQSKGVFTICLERAIVPSASRDDDEQS